MQLYNTYCNHTLRWKAHILSLFLHPYHLQVIIHYWVKYSVEKYFFHFHTLLYDLW